ncbi:MAG: DUF748 domain-containing protein [Myxococcota bacterium]
MSFRMPRGLADRPGELTGLALGSVLLVGACLVAVGLGASTVARWAVERQLRSGSDLSGRVDVLDVDLIRGRARVRGLTLDAERDSLVLRRVVVPEAHLYWSWTSLLSGALQVRGTAISPTVEARRRVGPPRELRDASEPWLPVAVDLDILDGTWVWTDPAGRASGAPFEHRITGVNGSYAHLGTAEGPGRLHVFGRLPGAGVVVATGSLDFLNAHGDALDLTFDVAGVDGASLDGGDVALTGMRMDAGTLDGTLRVTVDRGDVELTDPGACEGLTDDLFPGCLSAHVCGDGLSATLEPGIPVSAGSICVDTRVPLDAFGTNEPPAGAARFVVDASDLSGDLRAWGVVASEARVRVLEGVAEARGVALDAIGDGAVRSVRSPRVVAHWDPAALLQSQAVDAVLEVERPVIEAVRVHADQDLQRPDADLALDIHVRDGLLRWTDRDLDPPVTLELARFDLDVEGLGTRQERARWEIRGELGRGGTVSGTADFDAFGGFSHRSGGRARLHAVNTDLRDYADVYGAYLDLPPIDGQAAVEVRIHETGGWVAADVDGLDARFAEASVACGSGRMRLDWTDALGPEGRTLTGRLDHLDVTLHSGGTSDATPPARLPTLRVPELVVEDGSLTVHTSGGELGISDARVTLTDATFGSHRESGTAELTGSLWTGALAARLVTDHDGHRLEADLEDADLAEASAFLTPVTGFDASEGRVSVDAALSLAPSADLGGLVKLTFRDARFVDRMDWRNAATGLRNVAVGAAMGLIRDDGVAVLELPVGGTPEAPAIDLKSAYLQALLHRDRP